MREVCKNWLKVLGVMAAMLLLGGGDVWGQSGTIKLDVNVWLIQTRKAARSEPNNEFRYNIYFEGSTNKIQLEQKVNESDLPKSKPVDATISKYVTYTNDAPVKLLVDAWEEDCGGNNEYNSGCYVAGVKVGEDNRRSFVSHDIEYQDTQPGKWHGMYLEGDGKYSTYINFRWTAPIPPDPKAFEGEICSNQDGVLQFTVPNHLQKNHVVEWRWEWGKVEDVVIHPTDESCAKNCKDKEYTYGSSEFYGCYYPCFEEKKITKKEFVDTQTFSTTEDKLYYKSNGGNLQVRYQQVFSSGEVSDWSDPVSENNDFYVATEPTSVDTYEDDSKTNLFCGTTIKLKANYPGKDSDKRLDNHKFYWYRKIEGEDATPKPIAQTDDDEYSYTFPASMQGKTTYFSVKTKHTSCSDLSSDTVRTGAVFFFESVPTSFTVDTVGNTGRIKQKETSCAAATDGQIIIEGRADESDATYYYNIALKNKQGEIERTSILSSPATVGSEQFIFPDHILYPGSDKTDLSEERWRELTTIREGTYVVQVINGKKQYTLDSTLQTVGYCAKQFEIKVTPKPELSVGTPTIADSIDCHGDSTGRVHITFTGGRAPYYLQLFKGDAKNFATVGKESGEEIEVNDTQYTFRNLPTGHYKVQVTLSDGACWKETDNSIYLDQPAALSFTDSHVARSNNDPNYHGAWITCPGADDAYLEVSPSEGNRAGSYKATLYARDVEGIDIVHVKETSFTGTHKFDNLPPGNYKITVTDDCGNTHTPISRFNITEPAPLTINSVDINPITCHGVANGMIKVFASGGTGSRQFNIDGRTEWIDESSEPGSYEFAELDSGWHTIVARDLNGCITVEPFRVYLEYPDPLNFELDSLVMPLCHGGSDGKLFIRPFGGNPITQDYQVTIRSIVTADQPKLVEQTSGIRNSTMPPIEFMGLHSANYEVIVTDASTGPYTCYRVVDTVFLPQPDLITVNTVQITMPSCAGAIDGAVHIKASNGTPGTHPDYYYSIDGTAYVAPNEAGVAIFSNLEAGDYTFSAIDAHHAEYLEGYDTLTISPDVSLCVGTLSFTLKEPELITVYPTTQPVTCYGTATGSITIDEVTGGRGGYTYEWQVADPTVDGNRRLLTPEDSTHLTNLPAGSYILTVRDVAGCKWFNGIDITQPELPLTINAVQYYPESCEGTTDGKLEIRAEGGYPPYQYQIDGGAYQASNFFDGLAAGAYILTVRDKMGCEVRQMANLTTDEPTVEVVDQRPATIGFQDGLLRLNVTGGKNKSYYLDGVLSTTGAEFSGLTAGAHTVTIEYNGQCRWEQTYTIDEVAAPVPALRVTTQALRNVSCSDGADGSVSVTITGGVAPYTLQWNDPLQQTTSEIANVAKGTYTLSVTDAAGVTLAYTVTVDGPEPFDIINTVVASPACHQGADGSAEVTAIGGTAPYTYVWDDDRQQTTARANQLTAGTYTVTITDQNGCTLTQELTVAPTLAPDDVLEPQAITLCTGQSVTVDAGAEWNAYRWTADNGFSSTAQRITIDQAGRYFLQVTSIRGCVAYDTLDLVTTDNLIDAEFLLSTEIAAGDTVVLTEVSWPAPEQTVWLYDENVTTHQSDGEKEYVIFPEPGEYSIKLVVMVGACMDVVEKKIIVSDRAAVAPTTNGRLGYVPKNEYLIYPNPNHGKFTLKVSTSRSQRVRVSVYDPLFKYRYHQQTFADTRSLEEEMDLTQLKHGVYTLMIETADEIKILRFVIR